MLNTWIYVSNMKVNASKCKVLTVTRKNSPLTHEYHLANTYIKRVLEEEDLGVNKAYHLKQDAYCTQDLQNGRSPEENLSTYYGC